MRIICGAAAEGKESEAPDKRTEDVDEQSDQSDVDGKFNDNIKNWYAFLNKVVQWMME